VLTSDQANVVSENLLVAEREASDRAAAYRAGRSWSFSLVLAIFAFGVCGLIFFTWFFCRSTLEQWVARPRRYGFCIALFLRRRSSEAPSAQRRSRRVAVTISAGHESRRINTPPAPENRSMWLSRELPFGTGSLGHRADDHSVPLPARGCRSHPCASSRTRMIIGGYRPQ
jgi:hypothetical protein